MSTIAAISTSPGVGGIGIVRLSGENTFKVIEKIFKPLKKQTIKGYTMQYGHIIDKNNNIIDEVLISYFIKPKSYTTEDMCEINSHGNNIILKQILELCIENGAVLAMPGEFTQRAFLNGRIDLTQAESVIDLINAKSEKEKESAIHQLEGYLSLEIEKIKRVILDITADIEASIDYPEYDIEEKTNETIINETQKIVDMLKKLENSFEKGKILRDGVDVAIIGKPNAGKSSLLNAILKEERAIVTNIEGTTRDTIEEYITLDGVLFKIIDTAGIRESDDEIEKIGIDKSKKALKKADIVIAIFDSTQELNKEDKEILEFIKNKNAIILLNKIDLKDNKLKNNEQILSLNKPIIEISAQKRDGIEELYSQMINIFKINEINTENSTIITNVRHKNAIVCAEENLNKIKEVLYNGMPTDIVSIYLKNAIEELNKITGENVTEDIINEIFSKFCLGK
mgnify:CR=1 FL=1